ncbi:hypothetical protein EN943_01390 [Mesorhizobium sp. M7A.F.Ca.US.006.01.1.1]|uniref:hypothetical protein n=1 Tax=Mesorhizobium sp. M7A.F.Ca.US.006.01.1.1 TaxID=2496707 RepID=UPI000FCCB0D4|nr:hypothetical protein [Mesorhizobium sp. M7A.F.Ca.US.006.01.1.1]RUZ81279.1 hypothetical protein EN943_01390 [Mesorhizobium sp. M7A.F.Ca.US.006.01.1.1]
MNVDPTTANALNELLRELASELDLHYEDDAFQAIEPTVDAMKRAAKLVTDAGYTAPDSYHHIVRRFERNALPRR